MVQQTTIIIETRNQEKIILHCLKKIDDYTKKHQSIKAIFLDYNSKDETANTIIQYLKHNKNPRLTFLTTKNPLRQINTLRELINTEIYTPYVIRIETELYTELTQIRTTIKQLQRSELVIPNRWENPIIGKNTQKAKKERIKSHLKTKHYRFKKIKDCNNQYFGYKTKTLKENLETMTTKKDFWIKSHLKTERDNKKITQPKTLTNYQRKNSNNKKPRYLE